MGRYKTAPQTGKPLFRVIGGNASIYLKRQNRYLQQGEELVLEPHEAETLLAAGLVEKVEAPASHDDLKETEEN